MTNPDQLNRLVLLFERLVSKGANFTEGPKRHVEQLIFDLVKSNQSEVDVVGRLVKIGFPAPEVENAAAIDSSLAARVVI